MKRPFTVDTLNNATFAAAEAFEHWKQAVADSKREKRLQAQECRFCFYRRHLWGNDTADCACESCDKAMQADSFWKPRLCIACARQFHACKQCGADLHLKERRTLKRKSCGGIRN